MNLAGRACAMRILLRRKRHISAVLQVDHVRIEPVERLAASGRFTGS